MSDLTKFRDHCRMMATAEHRPECEGRRKDRWGWQTVRPDPSCPGYVTDGERALFARLAGEIDEYLDPHPTLEGM